MKQKDIFLKLEGDAWFVRNQASMSSRRLPDEDPLLMELLAISAQLSSRKQDLRILEIGCGDGTRLKWLKNNLNAECFGIEPSWQAVISACDKGIHAQQGSADMLPFKDGSFDIVIFGFCLYLCDREDLFRIASEADRVLINPG
jgi:ubiquinone/menaquinone biosynthesis C-methylase UbiE